jgi:hypothetical protein
LAAAVGRQRLTAWALDSYTRIFLIELRALGKWWWWISLLPSACPHSRQNFIRTIWLQLQWKLGNTNWLKVPPHPPKSETPKITNLI